MRFPSEARAVGVDGIMSGAFSGEGGAVARATFHARSEGNHRSGSAFLALLASWREEILVAAAGRAGIIQFVQQSQTENGRGLQFFLLSSGQGLMAISEGGEVHFFRQIRATLQVLGRDA